MPNGGATNGRDLNGGRHRKLNRETRRGRGYCAEAVWVRRVHCSDIDSGRRRWAEVPALVGGLGPAGWRCAGVRWLDKGKVDEDQTAAKER